MIFGRKFLLQTDHKPLLSIFGSKKGIPICTANRLQRWALILSSYEFDIEYINTESFGHADFLSRLINNHKPPDEEFIVASAQIEADINQVCQEISEVLPPSFSMVQAATENDTVIQTVMRLMQNGWPQKQNQIESRGVAIFFPLRKKSLSIVSKCLMLGDRLVIPKIFQSRVLKQFHRSHPGIEAMMSLMRSYVFWTGIDGDIEDYVKRSSKCLQQNYQPSPFFILGLHQKDRGNVSTLIMRDSSIIITTW